MKKVHLLFLFLAMSCEHHEIMADSENLEIFAPLEAGAPGKARLTRIYKIGETIDTTSYPFENVHLYLLENGVFFDSLTLTSNGHYESDKLIQEGLTYKLEGTIGQNSNISSQEVYIPQKINSYSLNYRPDTINFINPNIPAAFFEISFNDELENYILLDFRPIDLNESFNIPGVFFFNQNQEKEIADCTAGALGDFDVYDFRSAKLFDNNCIRIPSISLLVERGYYKPSTFPGSNSPQLIRYEQLGLKIGAITESYYLWSKSIGKQPRDIERFSVDPVINYSNIKGAQGVVFGMNITESILP